eukprot:sb/3465704/
MFIWFFLSLIFTSHQHSTLHSIPHSISGCYHGSEGTFYWTVKDDLLLLNISAEISGDDWVGLGFSKDSAMGDDDIVAVVPSNKSYTVLSLYNSNGRASTTYQEVISIVHYTTQYHDGEITADIVKKINISHPVSNLDSNPVYLFFGKGNINSVRPSTPLHKHYDIPSISRGRINLRGSGRRVLACISTQTGTAFKIHVVRLRDPVFKKQLPLAGYAGSRSEGYESNNFLVVFMMGWSMKGGTAHLYTVGGPEGILMVIVWLNISLSSVYVARYAKFYFTPATKWFTVHRLAGYSAVTLVLISVVCAAVGTGTLDLNVFVVFYPDRQHRGLFLHGFLAVCRPDKDTKGFLAVLESISRSYPLNCSSFCHICLEPRHDL